MGKMPTSKPKAGMFAGRAATLNPDRCYGPPAGPTGTLPTELAAQLKANGAAAAKHGPTDLSWFKSQVEDHGPWDYKRYDPAFENFGNYNYGYTGTRQGISPWLLRTMGGLVQLKDGTSKWAYRSSNFDDPRDQEQIRRGIQDALNGCY